jgi:dipeptidyl aminopeptidase/acylaminoacyl peptidase
MRSPQRYRCAISLAGPTDLREMLHYNANPFIPERYVRAWQRRIEGEEQTNLDAISPVRHPDLLRVPLLIAHGVADPIVPPQQSQRLLEALRRRGATVESAFYRKSGHGFTDSVEAADFFGRVETFLAHYNPADPPAAATSAAH